MRLKKYFLLTIVVAVFILFQSFKNYESVSGYHAIKPFNSGGTAFNGTGGRTGAPGDFGLCSDCHSGGAFSPTVSLAVRNSLNNIVTSYNPGEVYNLTFTVSASSSGFGMQATSLNSTYAARGTFSAPSSNARISSFSGRSYLEQNATSATGVFTSQWTAPVTGTGTITFYFAGLAVNGTGGTAGDNTTSGTSLQLTESILSTSADFAFSKAIQLKQNPVKDMLSIDISENYEKLNLEIFDSSGKKVYQKSYSNINKISENLNIESGIYFLKLNNEFNASAKLSFIKE